MSARATLRTATADAHRRVDDIFSRFPLGEAAGYRAFLRATAAAHLPVEAGLEAAGACRLVADWPERKRSHLIRRDLSELDARPVAEETPASFTSEAEMLGALYVLEGSRLGGALLRREVPQGLPVAFLGAPAPAGSWRRLSEFLDRRLVERQSLAEAIDAACQVFTCFAKAGLAELEPAQ